MPSNSSTAGERPKPQTRNQCRNCKQYISHQFARVFGNNDDEVFGCVECSTLTSSDQRSGLIEQ